MKSAFEMAVEAGFDADLPALREGTSIAIQLVKIVKEETKAAAMAAILDGCPSDGSDEELILRRAWDRVRQSAV